MERILYFFMALLAVATYKGLSNSQFRNKFVFETDGILVRKEYYRLLSSGFLHANWLHFLFNATAIYTFAEFLLIEIGPWPTLFLYTASLLGGSLLSLYVHRNHSDYSALGASGAAFGLAFATIAINPEGSLGFFFIPVSFTAWHVGLAFLLISIIGIKRNADNIGHEAHLGGAIVGLFLAPYYYRDLLEYNLLIYLVMLIPAIAFVIFIIKYPAYLLNSSIKAGELVNLPSFKFSGKSDEEELNKLLDKINAKGIESLSKSERKRLKRLSA